MLFNKHRRRRKTLTEIVNVQGSGAGNGQDSKIYEALRDAIKAVNNKRPPCNGDELFEPIVRALDKINLGEVSAEFESCCKRKKLPPNVVTLIRDNIPVLVQQINVSNHTRFSVASGHREKIKELLSTQLLITPSPPDPAQQTLFT